MPSSTKGRQFLLNNISTVYRQDLSRDEIGFCQISEGFCHILRCAVSADGGFLGHFIQNPREFSADFFAEESLTLYTDSACTQIFEGEWDMNADLTVYVKWGE